MFTLLRQFRESGGRETVARIKWGRYESSTSEVYIAIYNEITRRHGCKNQCSGDMIVQYLLLKFLSACHGEPTSYSNLSVRQFKDFGDWLLVAIFHSTDYLKAEPVSRIAGRPHAIDQVYASPPNSLKHASNSEVVRSLTLSAVSMSNAQWQNDSAKAGFYTITNCVLGTAIDLNGLPIPQDAQDIVSHLRSLDIPHFSLML